MSENKKSFVIYCDLINTIDHLTTLEKGMLFEHLLDYVNDKNPVLEDRVLLGTWKHIEQSLKRDLKKYEARANRSRENGALGGRPSKIKKPNKPTRLINNPSEPRKPDSVTVNDNIINNREADFKKSLQPFLGKYHKDLLNDFYLYWTEKNKNGKKMKFEMNKTFDVSRRLARWSNNNFNSNKNDKHEQRKQLSQIGTEFRAKNKNI